MTDQEEENIQEEFSMSYEKNDTNEKVLYIFLIIFLIIVICFAAGALIYFLGYIYVLYVKEGLLIMASDCPSKRTDFLSTRLR